MLCLMSFCNNSALMVYLATYNIESSPQPHVPPASAQMHSPSSAPEIAGLPTTDHRREDMMGMLAGGGCSLYWHCSFSLLWFTHLLSLYSALNSTSASAPNYGLLQTSHLSLSLLSLFFSLLSLFFSLLSLFSLSLLIRILVMHKRLNLFRPRKLLSKLGKGKRKQNVNFSLFVKLYHKCETFQMH